MYEGGGNCHCIAITHVPVIIGWDRVSNPGGLCVCVDDADSGHVDQGTLVKHDEVLERVEADDEVWLDGGSVQAVVFPARHDLVVVVDHLDRQEIEQGLAIGDGTGRPLVEEMVALCQAGALDDYPALAWAGSDEEDDSTTVRRLLDDTDSAAEMAGCLLKADDVDSLADTVDVAGIGWVPERCVVSHMRLGSHEELKADVFRSRRVPDEVAWPVLLLDIGSLVSNTPPQSLALVVFLGCVDAGLLRLGACHGGADVAGEDGGWLRARARRLGGIRRCSRYLACREGSNAIRSIR